MDSPRDMFSQNWGNILHFNYYKIHANSKAMITNEHHVAGVQLSAHKAHRAADMAVIYMCYIWIGWHF